MSTPSQPLHVLLKHSENDSIEFQLKTVEFDNFIVTATQRLLSVPTAEQTAFTNVVGFESEVDSSLYYVGRDVSETYTKLSLSDVDEVGSYISLNSPEDFEAMLQMLQELDQTPWKIVVRPVRHEPQPTAAPLPTKLLLRNSSDDQTMNSLSDGGTLDTTFKRGLNPAGIVPQSLKNLSALGSGFCGTVYKTLDVSHDRIIATKSVTIGIDEHAQNQILSEMQILQQCSSEFIIEFYAALFADDSFLLCFEYMNGGSLDKHGKLPTAVLGPVTASVLTGLLYLWNMKILHRDIKPSNVLWNTDGYVKLCDFGVSRQLENSIAQTYVGTKAYMAPERLRGGPYEICSDVWSFGVTMSELATGQFPFLKSSDVSETAAHIENTSEVALLERIATFPMSHLKSDLSKCEPSFGSLIDACLQRDVTKRATADQLRSDVYLESHTPIKRDLVAAHVRFITNNSAS